MNPLWTLCSTFALAPLVGLTAAPHAVLAQDTQPHTTAEPAPAAPDPEPAPSDLVTSPLSLQLNLDYTTAYFYRGIIQEDSGLILQPAAKLAINLHEDDDLKVETFLSIWNSFHGQKTAAQTANDVTRYWYECDVLGGVTLTTGNVSFTTGYAFLTSPSDAFETVQELSFTLAYDDTDLLEKLALHPYVLLAIETGADGSDGADKQDGVYLELGIAPGLSVDWGSTPIAISFPASIGLSLSNYYEDAQGADDTFGFAQIGAKASVPLPFGDRYGAWTLNAGLSALFLGDHTAEYNAGDHTELIGTVGIQLNF